MAQLFVLEGARKDCLDDRLLAGVEVDLAGRQGLRIDALVDGEDVQQGRVSAFGREEIEILPRGVAKYMPQLGYRAEGAVEDDRTTLVVASLQGIAGIGGGVG